MYRQKVASFNDPTKTFICKKNQIFEVRALNKLQKKQ